MSNLKRTLIHGLEHGLKVEYKLRDDSGFRLDGMYDEMEGQANVQGSMIDWLHEFDFVKPYLFDLTDLTKEIEIGGQRFVPKEWLRLNYIGESMGLNPATWSHRTIEKLCEWHFNCFNLSPDEFIQVDEINNPYK